jgi:signal transduction histidine kinase/CheY-like chemotaxis protein
MDLPRTRGEYRLRGRLWELRVELSAGLLLLISWWLAPLLYVEADGARRGAWSTAFFLSGAALFLTCLLLRLRALRRRLSTELDRHDQLTRQLRLHEAQSDALLGVLPDLTFKLDAAGNVTQLAGAGASARAPGGRTLSALVSEPVARQLLDCAREVASSGRLGQLDYQVRERDELTDFEARIARCDERQVVVMIRAVTQRKRLERELISAREGALEAARVKTKFLANMSHEIRTPMNGVIGMTNLLLETPLSSEQQEYANIIQKSGQALLAIIDDILDFAKIEAGKLELEEVDFDLYACVDQSLEAVASQAQAKKLELGAVFESGLSARVRGDPTRLRQVLANLLSNAVRYTERGFVLVRVGRAAAGDGSLLEFSVRDSGPGISEEAQSTLFHPVLLGEGATTSASGGAGLGLAIARELVQLMGGEIECETEPGKGSLFRFSARLLPRDSGRNSLDPSLFQSAPSRVFLVGAPEGELWPLEEQLNALGVGSLRVATRELAHAMRTDRGSLPCFCVLIDARLEPGAVRRVLSEVRADPKIRDASLVAVARAGDPHVDELRKEATRVLGWPVRQTELFACLSALLSRAHAVQSFRQSLVPPRAYHLLVAEDDPINQRVLRRTVQQLGFTCELVSDGAQAVELALSAHFDAVLMDCQMPTLDGFAAARKIRAHEAASGAARTCIVAMTASSSDDDRNKSREAAMDAFVTKPIAAEQLRELIVRLMGEGGAEAPRVREPTLDGARLDELRAGAAESDGVAQAAVDRFLEQAPRNLEAMRAALGVGDFQAVAKAANHLEASSAYLGALRLSRLSAELAWLTRSERSASVERGLESLSAEFDLLRRELSARQIAP